MSDIYFKCSCGKSLAVDERGVGQTVTCVDCMKSVKIPEPDMEFPCEICGDYMLAPKSMAGEEVQCVLCGETTTAPIPDAKVSGKLRVGIASAILLLLAAAGVYFTLLTRWKYEEEPVQGMNAPMAVQATRQVESDRVFQETLEAFEVTSDVMPDAAICEAERNCELSVDVMEKPVVSEPTQETQTASLQKSETESESPIVPATGNERVALKKAEVRERLFDVVANFQKAAKLHAGTVEEHREFCRLAPLLRSELLEIVKAGAGLDLSKGHRHWEVAFQELYEFALNDKNLSYRESERLTQEGLSILFEVYPENRNAAGHAAMSIFSTFAYIWLEREPEKVADILEDMEQRFLSGQTSPGLKEFWYFRSGGLHSRLFMKKHCVPNARRIEFAQKCAKSVSICIEDEDVSLKRRSRSLASWSYFALFQQGYTDEATTLLREWWNRHGDKIDEMDFYLNWMTVELLGNGDWEQASMILKTAGAQKQSKKETCSSQAFDAMTEIYYANILLPGCELRRQQRIKQQASREKLTMLAGVK